jgi:hypothetical protein
MFSIKGFEESENNIIKMNEEYSSTHIILILEYLYTDLLPNITTKDAIQLYYISVLFEIDNLKPILRSFIKNGMLIIIIINRFRF